MTFDDGREIRLDDHEQDHRHKPCPKCGLLTRLYKIHDEKMCEGCGRDKIREWNRLMEEAHASPGPAADVQ